MIINVTDQRLGVYIAENSDFCYLRRGGFYYLTSVEPKNKHGALGNPVLCLCYCVTTARSPSPSSSLAARCDLAINWRRRSKWFDSSFISTAVIPHSRFSGPGQGEVIVILRLTTFFFAEVTALGFDIARYLYSKKYWWWIGLLFYLMNKPFIYLVMIFCCRFSFSSRDQVW